MLTQEMAVAQQPKPTEPKPKGKTANLRLLTRTVQELQDVAEVEGKEPYDVAEELLRPGLTARVARYRVAIDRIHKLRAEMESVKVKAREKPAE